MIDENGLDERAHARRGGLRNVLIGLGLAGAMLGLVAIGAAAGWATVPLSGAAFLLSWIFVGFGLGEFAFAGRLRVVTMLLALLVGIAGVGLNFYVIGQLGFHVAK